MIHGNSSDVSSSTEIAITRAFAAPRDLVFKIWTDPAYVALWWGLNGARNIVHQMDVRPGGRWRIDMLVASGTNYPNGGQFLEVVENERLTYTDEPSPDSPAWNGSPPNPTINTVDFENSGQGTLVRLTVRFSSESDMQRMTATGIEKGISQGLDRLSRLVDRIVANLRSSK